MEIVYTDIDNIYTPDNKSYRDRFPDKFQTKDINFISYANWRDYLINILLNCFRWSGLPDNIPPRAIELSMVYNGLGAFFEIVPGKYGYAPATPKGNLDMYYNPIEVNIYNPNGQGTWARRCTDDVVYGDYGLEELKKECVILYDNVMRIPMLRYADVYARRLSKADRVCDVNINSQMTPWIAKTSEMGKKDLYNIMLQITGNESVIIENESIVDDTTIDVLNTSAPFVANDVMDAQSRILNHYLTIIGVNNSFNTKKEREISKEVDSNNEQVVIIRKSRLDTRKEFADNVNAMYGLDISVGWNVDYIDGDDVVLDMDVDV